ncbi:helix-turn-helix domain-containing protein [Burkholderia ambifaria]|uniref:helix-turn-helix domain-containing protein n=1 Tax=Burkholderia ambifaria TaxID=152480 RepID=UPI001FC891AA|nr:helix-turn-helix domain-containing protein [Burkholderia ambifaria]
MQQLSINHPYQDMRTRAAALLMLAGGKLRPMAVGEKLGVSGQSVYNWAHTWREQGMIGLLVKIGHKGGRPRALSDEMIAAVVQMASVEPLTREQIVRRLDTEFGPLPTGRVRHQISNQFLVNTQRPVQIPREGAVYFLGDLLTLDT